MEISDFIYVVIALQGAFLSAFLVFKKSKRQTVLAIVIAIIAIDSISHIALISPYTYLLNHGNLFALGPLLYVFYELLGDDQWRKRLTLHIIPILILKLLLVIIYLGDIPVSVQWSMFMSFIMVGYNLAYLLFILILLRRKQRKSLAEKKLTHLVYLFILGWLLALAARFFDLNNDPSSQIFWKLAYAFAGMLIYYLTLSFMITPRVFNLSSYSYRKGMESESGIMELMEKEKLYLDPEFKREDLAVKLGIDPHELSYVLNEQMHISFNDLVNKFRIEDCQIRLMNHEAKDKTILTIGLECGFGSKATFQRAFKKHTGITPLQFIKKEVSNN